MAISAEMSTPKVLRNVTLTLDEEEAGLLMAYIANSGSWVMDKGGPVAERAYYALERAGVKEA